MLSAFALIFLRDVSLIRSGLRKPPVGIFDVYPGS